MSSAPETSVLAKPEALLRVPVGLSSPLWGFYAGAAVTGAAWWWMTRWTQAQNLEAMFGRAAETPALALEPPALDPEAVIEPAVEAVETVVESVVEAARVAEAIVDEPDLAAPVGGESAPIAPVAAADPTPKPRVKKAEPKAD